MVSLCALLHRRRTLHATGTGRHLPGGHSLVSENST